MFFLLSRYRARRYINGGDDCRQNCGTVCVDEPERSERPASEAAPKARVQPEQHAGEPKQTYRGAARLPVAAGGAAPACALRPAAVPPAARQEQAGRRAAADPRGVGR